MAQTIASRKAQPPNSPVGGHALRDYFVSPAAGDGVPVNAPDSPYTLALSPGTLLAGRFRIDGPVSSASAFAITYNAKDQTNGDSVVVKEFFPRSLVSRTDGGAVRPHSAEDERDFLRALRRFALEGAALAEASHPNLVRVRRVIEANDTVYLVMDRHQTQPLSDFLSAAGGRLPATHAGRLVQQLLSALEPLHAESIIHRDLSPRSLHVSAEGNALLLGFSARRHLAIHAADLVPGFAAFEQYGTRDIGPWTDVYAASAILYYLLTGTTPPSALDRAAGEALVPPSSAVAGVSSGLTRLVLRGMALLPQQRPHAATEMRRQLETALAENTSVAGAPAGSPNSLGFDASLLASMAGEDAERGSTLRLAEGGIVVPGSDSTTPWLLRKLGTVMRRTPTEQDFGFDSAALERLAAPAPAALREPPQPFVASYAPPAVAPMPVAEASPSVQASEPDAVPAVRESPDIATALSLLEIASLPEKPRRQLEISEELALASAEMHFGFNQPHQRRRYSLVAAAVLVIGVGSSLLLLTRKGGASSERVTAGNAGEVAAPASGVPSRPATAPTQDPAGSGAMQQSKVTLTRTQTERAAATDNPSTTAHATAEPAPTTKTNSAPAAKPTPTASSPTSVLPSGSRLPNVSVAVNAGSDLRMLPPEALVDARTRLTNGQDLVEQGDYQIARRTFRTALTQLDSISARYPESQSIRALRHDIEQADARAVQACGAENEMRKRRAEAPRVCQ